MNYDISLIIPLYNCGDMLRDVVNSVINQTLGFDRIELILIDDKSTDNTREIMKEFDKYENCKCIYLETNSGSPSLPRNIGIKNATGKYIMFMDEDDSITKNCCKAAFDIAEKTNADIVHFNDVRKMIDGIYAPKNVKIDENYKNITNVKERLELRLTMWGNLFLNSFIKNNNIKVPLTLYEDGVFSIESYILADKFIQMPNYYSYIYTIEKERDESITHNINIDRCESFLEGFKNCNNLLIKHDCKKYTPELFNKIIPMLYFMFFKLNATKDEKLKILKDYHDFITNLNYDITLENKALNKINQNVLNENYKKALFYCNIGKLLYENRYIKNQILKKYSNIEKIEIE